MSDFGETRWPVSKQERRCEFCYGPIPAGERHAHYAGMWNGEWQNWRMHEECHTVYTEDDPLEGFMPGDGEMPARVKLLVKDHSHVI